MKIYLLRLRRMKLFLLNSLTGHVTEEAELTLPVRAVHAQVPNDARARAGRSGGQLHQFARHAQPLTALLPLGWLLLQQAGFFVEQGWGCLSLLLRR